MHSAGSHGGRIRAVVKMQFTAMKVRWPRAPSSQRGGVLFALCEKSQLSYDIVRRLPQSLQPAFRFTGGGLGTYLNCQCLIKMDLPSDYCSLEKPALPLMLQTFATPSFCLMILLATNDLGLLVNLWPFLWINGSHNTRIYLFVWNFSRVGICLLQDLLWPGSTRVPKRSIASPPRLTWALFRQGKFILGTKVTHVCQKDGILVYLMRIAMEEKLASLKHTSWLTLTSAWATWVIWEKARPGLCAAVSVKDCLDY